MKTRFLFLFFLISNAICIAQDERYPVVDKQNVPYNYVVSAPKSKIQLSLAVDAFTKSLRPFNKLPNDSLGTIVFLENAQNAFVSVRLRKDSLPYYRYTVIENDQKIIIKDAVPQKVHMVWIEGSDFPGHLTMDLGIGNITNKKTTIKIYRLPDNKTVTTLILYNKKLQDAQLIDANAITFHSTKDLFIRTFKKLVNNSKILIDEETRYVRFSIAETDLNHVYTVYTVRTSPEGDHLDFASSQVSWQYDSLSKNPYCLLPAYNFHKPGTYQIHIQPQLDEQLNISEIYKGKPQLTFEVLKGPRLYKTKDIVIYVVVFLIAISLVVSLVIFIIRKRHLYKLRKVEKVTEATKAQLDQILSRLNPHFVYNSLSGIQNLINSNEVENANSYLSKFARLTRNVLNEKEVISIEDERNLLEDYLAMEALRFKFSYEIRSQNFETLKSVEVPTMLLQPFVENACKHAMSKLREKGVLVIDIASEVKDLLFIITDNGTGFDANIKHEGLGLLLCEKRIALLNKIYKECPLVLDISSAPTGTKITLTLKNWL
jgi:two-component system LytT family sensor kinase